MKHFSNKFKLAFVILLVIGSLVSAQDFWRRGRRRGRSRSPEDYGRNGVPMWENDKSFKDDTFAFARLRCDRHYKWATDYPDADLNLSYRLQEMTALKTDPNGKVISPTDPELFNYPFVYLVEPGEFSFTQAEVDALRKYLLRGGFLMVDDFWGEWEWENFEQEIRRVFPNRPIEDLTIEHEIFHMVYDLKEKPIIPSIGHYRSGRRTERRDAQEPHYRAIKDDEGRLMMIICHNTDLGDGWEREGENRGYFEEFSEKYAYPLGINIITYAMTH